MITHPFFVGGTERFDTVLMEETGGRVLSKIGAEGVHSAVILDQAIGISLKVEDGNSRAQYPALLHLLDQLDALPRPISARLAEYLHKPLRNSRGEIIGEMTVVGRSSARQAAPALA
jgi:L-asparaginase II